MTAPGGDTATLGGAGGAPLVPGTGSALGLDKDWFGASTLGAFEGCVPFGVPVGLPGALGAPGAPGKPVLTAGLIDALGGTGALPCWIRVALCATAGGSTGVAPPCPGAPATTGAGTAPLGLAPPFRPGTGPRGPGGGGRLMTLLMTALLWMLAKMMLFGGGATYTGARTYTGIGTK
ncbi:MAG: hypothetical protein CTY30_12270, partial [Methylocystis sp.]